MPSVCHLFSLINSKARIKGKRKREGREEGRESMEVSELDSIIDRLLNRACWRWRRRQQVQLSETEIRRLCDEARRLFLAEPSLLELPAPINICGDIHGHYDDLLRLLHLGGLPPASRYLFLGDYVDRGSHNLDTICLLLAYKLRHPDRVHLLRGNHEDERVNRIYGFYDECTQSFGPGAGEALWRAFAGCFDCLPIAAVVGGRILCVHGGISPDLKSLDQIRGIQRPTGVPDAGLLCDLLWSDPDHTDTDGWSKNEERGVSFKFGPDRVVDLLDSNNLDLICRAHQVVKHGIEFFAEKRMVTIFSAPNYAAGFKNRGALLTVDRQLMCYVKTIK